MNGAINIHAVIPASSINGPGRRTVVFFQGCGRGCPGCFNPDTHPFGQRELLTVADILAMLPEGPVEGITVSGGEPFMQTAGLLSLLKAARARGLTTVVYTGFRMEELSVEQRACLEYIDVLVDGGYEEDRAEPTLLARGSSNQVFHFLTSRYDIEDFRMQGRIELSIGRDGIVTGTGFGQISFSE